MYLPKHFEETSIEVRHELIRAQPLATLITLSSVGINANHIPFVLSESPEPYGKLQAHVPRANSLVSDLVEGTEALAIFHGPNAYITPSWYATKQETGKVVPTWNYSVVHAYGQLQIFDDPSWVRRQVEALTDENESKFPNPWKVTDAPSAFTDRLIKGLVGIEIVITRIQGKTKASQNQSDANRVGVVDGLKSLGDSNASNLAELTSIGTDNVGIKRT